MIPASPWTTRPRTSVRFMPILVASMPPGMCAAPYPTMNSEIR